MKMILSDLKSAKPKTFLIVKFKCQMRLTQKLIVRTYVTYVSYDTYVINYYLSL